MYSYILRANGHKALAIKSDLTCLSLRDLIRRQSKPVHPDSHDRVWRWGTVEFVNPEVMLPSQFTETLPALIGII